MSNETAVRERLLLLKEEMSACIRAKKHLPMVEQQLLVLQQEVVNAREVMQKEHRDLEELEKTGLKRLFSQVLGKAEDRMDVERQEYMQALLHYRSLKQQIELAQYEIEVLTAQVHKHPAVEKELKAVQKKAERVVKASNEQVRKEIVAQNLLIDLAQARIHEIQEAEQVASEISTLLDKTLKQLRKIKQWRAFTHPMHGKGRYSSYAKKSFIDDSQQDVVKVQHLLEKLDRELADVYKDYQHGLHIRDFSAFVDSFYDYLITDWLIQRGLANAVKGTELAYNRLQRVTASLVTEHQLEIDRIAACTARKNELIDDGLIHQEL